MGKRQAKRQSKAKLHPRNKHRKKYDFLRLTQACPALAPFVRPNKYGNESIDFSNPTAIKLLTQFLLKVHYEIDHWEIPEGYLCPPVPGRADYIHHIADLLAEYDHGKIPIGPKIKCLDIGTGANCIYPIIGHKEYGWKFIGTDIDTKALESAEKIIDSNNDLKENIELRLQKNPSLIFREIIKDDEYMDLVVCNPPFHASEKEAEKAAERKLRNLNLKEEKRLTLNFGGKSNELWREGGEFKFIQDMILESKVFSTSCFWFTTLVSKKENLRHIYQKLKEIKALEMKTIEMGQGNKLSRIIAWTFLDKKQQEAWRRYKWE